MRLPVTTTFNIEGYRIKQYLGVVRGIIVRAPTISQGILGGLKSIIGGQIGSYTEMCEQTRQQAYDLLLDHAQGAGSQRDRGDALRRIGDRFQGVVRHGSALLWDGGHHRAGDGGINAGHRGTEARRGGREQTGITIPRRQAADAICTIEAPSPPSCLPSVSSLPPTTS